MDKMESAERNERIEEAVKRMTLLGIKEEDVAKYKEKGEIPASFADHQEKKVCKFVLDEEQNEIIAALEKDRGFLVFYTIVDTGRWPDGSAFERWTFLILDGCKAEWKMERDVITKFGNVLAYVYNCEEPGCSEICEIPFRNIGGFLINIG